MNIGKAIKDLRIEKKLNQTEFANKCGITQTTLSQIETGNKTPNSGTLKRISSFLQIPETVIYLLATDESDIPDSKKKMFQTLFPGIKTLLLDLLTSTTV